MTNIFKHIWSLSAALVLAFVHSNDCEATDSAVSKPSLTTSVPTFQVVKMSPKVIRDFCPHTESQKKEFARQDAHTDWIYHCVCDVDCKMLDEKTSPGFVTAQALITGLHVTLSLPITIHESKSVTKKTDQHESGHAQICQVIYEQAEQAALQSGRELVGQKFSGKGIDVQHAMRVAAGKAVAAMSRKYRDRIILKAQMASNIYDRLEKEEKDVPSQTHVTKALRDAAKITKVVN